MISLKWNPHFKMIEKRTLLSAHATLHTKKGQAKYQGIQLRFQLYL